MISTAATAMHVMKSTALFKAPRDHNPKRVLLASTRAKKLWLEDNRETYDRSASLINNQLFACDDSASRSPVNKSDSGGIMLY